jgi:hypothetical protein
MSYAARKRKAIYDSSMTKRQVLPQTKVMDSNAKTFLETIRTTYKGYVLASKLTDLNTHFSTGVTGITGKWNDAIKGISFAYSTTNEGVFRTTNTTGTTKTVAEVYKMILLCDLKGLLDLSSVADKTITEADQTAMVTALTPNPLYTLEQRNVLANQIGSKYTTFNITIQEYMSKSSTDQVRKDLLTLEEGLITKLTADNITSLNFITDVLAAPFTAGEILTTIGKTYTGVRQINTADPPCSVKSLSCVGLVPDNNITYITPCDTTNEGLSGSTTEVKNANYYYKLQHVISLPDTDTDKVNVATAAGTTPANLTMAILDDHAVMMDVLPELIKVTTIPSATETTICNNNTSDDCTMWDAYGVDIFNKTFAVPTAYTTDKALYCCNPKTDKVTHLLAAIIQSTNYTTLLEDVFPTPPKASSNKTIFYIIAAVIVLVIVGLLVMIFMYPKKPENVVAATATPSTQQTFVAA